MRALPFLLTFAVPASVVAGFWLGGWWTFLTVVQNYDILPLLDHLLGPNEADVPARHEGEIGNAFAFRAIAARSEQRPPPRAHSCRKASTGSMLAARQAG